MAAITEPKSGGLFADEKKENMIWRWSAEAHGGELSNEPNVVPMIDILLVLLIIFMITQPLSRMALDVQVPPPDTPR